MFQRLTSNASLKALSILIATVLWFVVLGSRNVEIAKEVPIEIVPPADLIVANEVPDKVSFRLAGPKAFLRNVLNRKEDAIRVNLTSAKAGLITYRFFTDNIQVPLGVKVLSINPTAIVVKLEANRKKEVPVRLVLRGEASPGYKINNIELLKNTIRIRGPESRVEQISELATVPLDISTLQDAGEKDIPIDLGKVPGIQIDGEIPRVRYTVAQTFGTYKIRNADVKVLTNRRFEVEPKEVTILVRASAEDLKMLTASRTYVTVDLRNKGPGQYPNQPLSTHLPSTAKLIRVVPNKVKVTLY